MKILVLAGEIPATTNMAGSPRLFSLCRYLAQSHQLTLATFTKSRGRHASYLADPTSPGVFEEIVILPDPPAPDWWGRQLHRMLQEAHFITRVRNRQFYLALCGRIRDMVRQGGFDLVYVDGLSSAQYLMDAAWEAPAAVDLHDCVTLLYSRKTQVEKHWLNKLRLYSETMSISRWERSLSRVFEVIITNSPVDESYLKRMDPKANTVTIGNGVDSEFFHSNHGAGDPSNLVFTGVMNYGPNEDAVLYFCQSILPLILKSNPGVQFNVVGKDPTPQVRSLAQQPGVRIAGEVPDVRPYLEAAGIFVCPLRWGAGVKNKLLAALAMGKAVVATRQSIEGLDLQDEVHLLLADEPADFAAKVVRLIGDPAAARRLGQSGQELVTSRYSWKGSARILDETLRSVVARHRASSLQPASL